MLRNGVTTQECIHGNSTYYTYELHFPKKYKKRGMSLKRTPLRSLKIDGVMLL